MFVQEHRVTVLVWPVVSEIDHRSAMSVPTSDCILFGRPKPVTNVVFANEVQMVRHGWNPLVGILARLAISPRLVMSALDYVKKMRVDAIADERLAIVVPVDTPGVGRTIREWFPDMPQGMISVHATIEARPRVVRHSRLTDHRPICSAVRAIQPAVRSPGECVCQIVRIRVIAEAIKQHLRLAYPARRRRYDQG